MKMSNWLTLFYVIRNFNSKNLFLFSDKLRLIGIYLFNGNLNMNLFLFYMYLLNLFLFHI